MRTGSEDRNIEIVIGLSVLNHIQIFQHDVYIFRYDVPDTDNPFVGIDYYLVILHHIGISLIFKHLCVLMIDNAVRLDGQIQYLESYIVQCPLIFAPLKRISANSKKVSKLSSKISCSYT